MNREYLRAVIGFTYNKPNEKSYEWEYLQKHKYTEIEKLIPEYLLTLEELEQKISNINNQH